MQRIEAQCSQFFLLPTSIHTVAVRICEQVQLPGPFRIFERIVQASEPREVPRSIEKVKLLPDLLHAVFVVFERPPHRVIVLYHLSKESIRLLPQSVLVVLLCTRLADLEALEHFSGEREVSVPVGRRIPWIVFVREGRRPRLAAQPHDQVGNRLRPDRRILGASRVRLWVVLVIWRVEWRCLEQLLTRPVLLLVGPRPVELIDKRLQRFGLFCPVQVLYVLPDQCSILLRPDLSIPVGLKDRPLCRNRALVLLFPFYILVQEPRPLPLIRVKLLCGRVQLELEIEDPIELEYLSDLILLIAPLQSQADIKEQFMFPC